MWPAEATAAGPFVPPGQRRTFDEAGALHASIKAAATFIHDHRQAFPGGCVPTAPSDLAILAIKVHGVFLDPAWQKARPASLAQRAINASRAFDAQPHHRPEGERGHQAVQAGRAAV